MNKLTVLCVGNSLTCHAPAEHIGWNRNHGMAASCIENDYVHVLESMLNSSFPSLCPSVHTGPAFAFENAVVAHCDKDYTEALDCSIGSKMKEINPDVVVFQWGDNTKNYSYQSYKYALNQAVDYVKAYNNDALIIMVKPFYGYTNSVQSMAINRVATDKKTAFVDISTLNIPENLPYIEFPTGPVAGHPGDKGMKEIAETLYDVIKVFAEYKIDGRDFTPVIQEMLKDLPLVDESNVHSQNIPEGSIVYLDNANHGTDGFEITTNVEALKCVPNPDGSKDMVFHVECKVHPKRMYWTYFYCECTGKVEAGDRYMISFDVMHDKASSGKAYKNSKGGICFTYSIDGKIMDSAKTAQGVEALFTLDCGEWKHYNFIYTLPDNLDEDRCCRFGIFSEPVNRDGDISGMGFCLKEVKCTRYNGDFDDGFLEQLFILHIDTFTKLC